MAEGSGALTYQMLFGLCAPSSSNFRVEGLFFFLVNQQEAQTTSPQTIFAIRVYSLSLSISLSILYRSR